MSAHLGPASIAPPEDVALWIKTKALAAASKKTTLEQREARLLVQYGARVIEAKQRCENMTDEQATACARDYVGKSPKDFQLAVDAWNRDQMAALRTEAEVQRRVGDAKEALFASLASVVQKLESVVSTIAPSALLTAASADDGPRPN